MPSFCDHAEHSRHNLAFLDSFFLKRFNDWAITAMFYSCVHMVEAILDKSLFMHSQNHQERSGNLANLASFPKNAYKALERAAHDSRYKRYKIYSWETHRIFKDHFRRLVKWFNGQVEESQALDIETCENLDGEWYEKYKANEPGCNSCC
jgi:hypothetical protein